MLSGVLSGLSLEIHCGLGPEATLRSRACSRGPAEEREERRRKEEGGGQADKESNNSPDKWGRIRFWTKGRREFQEEPRWNTHPVRVAAMSKMSTSERSRRRLVKPKRSANADKEDQQ